MFTWEVDEAGDPGPGIYYGRDLESSRALVKIPASDLNFIGAGSSDPVKYENCDNVPYLVFQGFEAHQPLQRQRTLVFKYDIIYGGYWLLAGVREPSYHRSRMDDLDLTGTFFFLEKLYERPLVSIYANILRSFFEMNGFHPAILPWMDSKHKAAFLFTHDVDYPQIIKWIETIRLLKNRGTSSFRSIRGVWNGSNNFWKFNNWVEFERQFGASGAFYFMARRGSLVKYALGTPDAFYKIDSQKFRRLFGLLVDLGCEIGLHASYRAFQSGEQIGIEKAALEKAAGVAVTGNRHHYWHLDPDRPWETLRLGEAAGLSYDSSLEFEYYPGFRRGICHPFHPYHPELRRELTTLELPPTWMDNHFVDRLSSNFIDDPEGYAQQLLNQVRLLNGIVVLDYHVRGMNADFYPGFGRWLMNFMTAIDTEEFSFQTPQKLCQEFISYEYRLSS